MDFSKLKFSFNLADADYKLDELQNQLLQLYVRQDKKFRRAFHTNFTNSLFKFIVDKTELKEPIHISIMGQVRGGKSYGAISSCVFHQAQYKKLFTADYICANAFEFIDKLQKMPKEELTNRIFLVDEEKQSVFGVGSLAKKMKISDVQNIIAINNISTIMINPTGWQNKEAFYGLRAFGRCFKTKTVRFMLYNLQEKAGGGSLPMGCVYLPIFTSYLPKEEADKLEKEYLDKKNAWVDAERRGQGDVLETLKKKTAVNFLHDVKFRELKKRKDRVTYISLKLGSEWTKNEIESIENIVKLLEEGSIDENEL